nr:hypothetical protein Iba_chr12aCG1390 [Ipomoea batatas]
MRERPESASASVSTPVRTPRSSRWIRRGNAGLPRRRSTSPATFLDRDCDSLSADLRSSPHPAKTQAMAAGLVVLIPGGDIRFPARNIRRNGARKHQNRRIGVGFPPLFLERSLLNTRLGLRLRLSQYHREQLLPETRRANADAAAQVGQVFLTPHLKFVSYTNAYTSVYI